MSASRWWELSRFDAMSIDRLVDPELARQDSSNRNQTSWLYSNFAEMGTASAFSATGE